MSAFTLGSLTAKSRNGESTTRGVLRAIANLPDGVRDLLGVDSADVLTRGTVTDDDEGMTFQIDDNVVMQLRPFARTITLIALNATGDECTVSYNGGFRSQDIERLLGFYELAKRGSLGQTSDVWAESLDGKLVHNASA